MSEPNPATCSPPICLHCQIWEFIVASAPKGPGGRPIYHSTEILGNLLEVAAEVVAAHPREQRAGLINRFGHDLRIQVRRKLASGDHPEGMAKEGGH
jgi:hypothetical protein